MKPDAEDVARLPSELWLVRAAQRPLQTTSRRRRSSSTEVAKSGRVREPRGVGEMETHLKGQIKK